MEGNTTNYARQAKEYPFGSEGSGVRFLSARGTALEERKQRMYYLATCDEGSPLGRGVEVALTRLVDVVGFLQISPDSPPNIKPDCFVGFGAKIGHEMTPNLRRTSPFDERAGHLEGHIYRSCGQVDVLLLCCMMLSSRRAGMQPQPRHPILVVSRLVTELIGVSDRKERKL